MELFENKGKDDNNTLGVSSKIAYDLNALIHYNIINSDTIYQLLYITALCNKHNISLRCDFECYVDFIKYLQDELEQKIILNEEKDLLYNSLNDLMLLNDTRIENIVRFINSYTFENVIDFIRNFSADVLCRLKRHDYSSTPSSLSKLAVELFNYKNDSRVLDIFSNTSDFLIQSFEKNMNCRLFGNTLNKTYELENRIKLFLLNANYDINRMSFLSVIDDRKYDYIFGNVPFQEKNVTDFYSYDYDFKSINSSEWKYIFKSIDCLNVKGKAIFILPPKTMYRLPDKDIRKNLIDNELIEAIIKLPTKIHHYTSITTYMLIISRNNKVIKFLDASDDFKSCTPRTNSVDYKKIALKINNDNECKLVSFQEIQNNEYNLNPDFYINKKELNFKNPKRLSDFIEVFRGCQNKELLKEDINGKCKLINLANIENGLLNRENMKTIKYDDKIEKFLIKDKDVLITARGSRFESAVVELNENEVMLASGNLIVLRPISNKLNSYYLKLFLDSEKGQYQLFNKQIMTTILSINPVNINDIMIEYKTLDIQKNIAEEYKKRINKISEYNKNISLLREEIQKLI